LHIVVSLFGVAASSDWNADRYRIKHLVKRGSVSRHKQNPTPFLQMKLELAHWLICRIALHKAQTLNLIRPEGPRFARKRNGGTLPVVHENRPALLLGPVEPYHVRKETAESQSS
jgi:hypothetical protein